MKSPYMVKKSFQFLSIFARSNDADTKAIPVRRKDMLKQKRKQLRFTHKAVLQ